MGAGLLVLARDDHVVHLVVHGVMQHPERAGCLRDSLVLGHALGGCTRAELEAVTARLAAMPGAARLLDALAEARALAGEGPAGAAAPDRFRHVAALAYLAHGAGGPWRAPLLAGCTWGAAFALQAGGGAFAHRLRGVASGPPGTLAPRAAVAVPASLARLARRARYLLGALLAAPLVFRARRLVRSADRGARDARGAAA